MIIKEAQYEEKQEVVRRRVKDAVYGCDQCKKAIREDTKVNTHLEFTIFFNHKEAERHEVCSWFCAVNYLKKVKTDYFVSLPFLYYDTREKGLRARDFFALVKRVVK